MSIGLTESVIVQQGWAYDSKSFHTLLKMNNNNNKEKDDELQWNELFEIEKNEIEKFLSDSNSSSCTIFHIHQYEWITKNNNSYHLQLHIHPMNMNMNMNMKKMYGFVVYRVDKPIYCHFEYIDEDHESEGRKSECKKLNEKLGRKRRKMKMNMNFFHVIEEVRVYIKEIERKRKMKEDERERERERERGFLDNYVESTCMEEEEEVKVKFAGKKKDDDVKEDVKEYMCKMFENVKPNWICKIDDEKNDGYVIIITNNISGSRRCDLVKINCNNTNEIKSIDVFCSINERKLSQEWIVNESNSVVHIRTVDEKNESLKNDSLLFLVQGNDKMNIFGLYDVHSLNIDDLSTVRIGHCRLYRAKEINNYYDIMWEKTDTIIRNLSNYSFDYNHRDLLIFGGTHFKKNILYCNSFMFHLYIKNIKLHKVYKDLSEQKIFNISCDFEWKNNRNIVWPESRHSCSTRILNDDRNVLVFGGVDDKGSMLSDAYVAEYRSFSLGWRKITIEPVSIMKRMHYFYEKSSPLFSCCNLSQADNKLCIVPCTSRFNSEVFSLKLSNSFVNGSISPLILFDDEFSNMCLKKEKNKIVCCSNDGTFIVYNLESNTKISIGNLVTSYENIALQHHLHSLLKCSEDKRNHCDVIIKVKDIELLFYCHLVVLYIRNIKFAEIIMKEGQLNNKNCCIEYILDVENENLDQLFGYYLDYLYIGKINDEMITKEGQKKFLVFLCKIPGDHTFLKNFLCGESGENLSVGKLKQDYEHFYTIFFSNNLTWPKELSNLNSKIIKLNNDQEIPVHTLFLCRFEYFEKLIYSGFSESKSNVINFTEYNPETVRTIIKYLYTDSCDINFTNCVDLLIVSNKLQMNELSIQCAKFISVNVNQENLTNVILISEYLNDPILLKSILLQLKKSKLSSKK